MAVSKRSMSLGREHAGQVAQSAAESAAARSKHSPVAQWRVEHGFAESPDPDHACTGRCTFVNVIDNVYLCEKCGWEHVCDEQCKERVLDTANGMPVCPISGMCFDQLEAGGWEASIRCCYHQRSQNWLLHARYKVSLGTFSLLVYCAIYCCSQNMHLHILPNALVRLFYTGLCFTAVIGIAGRF